MTKPALETCTTAPKEWPAEIILPEDQRTQYAWDYESQLPKDGLPRMTLEGIEILAEGLRGDFHRWRWGIGNHPLEMPQEHLRNITIHAMKDRPHFMAAFWFGTDYPIVNYRVCTPRAPFDTLDRMITKYHTEPPTSVHLRSSADYWQYVPVQIGDNLLWDDKARAKWAPGTTEPDEDEPEDYCEASSPRNGTLDAWMGADE